jgi:hypothetical protein
MVPEPEFDGADGAVRKLVNLIQTRRITSVLDLVACKVRFVSHRGYCHVAAKANGIVGAVAVMPVVKVFAETLRHLSTS